MATSKVSPTGRILTTSNPRHIGKERLSWLDALHVRENLTGPFAYMSEFKHIGVYANHTHVYQVHNKTMTAFGDGAQAVPTVDGMWYNTIPQAIQKLRPSTHYNAATMSQGAVLLWRRRHGTDVILQAIAALLMLHDQVVIARSFDAGEKL